MKGTTEIQLPRFLDRREAPALYQNILDAGRAQALAIRWGACAWLEPSELLKLAVLLADVGRKGIQICLELPMPADSGELPGHQKRTAETIDFARRVGFFAFLAAVPGIRFELRQGARHEDATTPLKADAFIVQSLDVTPASRRRSTSLLEITRIDDSKGTDSAVEALTSSDRVQELVDQYSSLDFLTSGEFALLVVSELAENVVDHGVQSGNHTSLALGAMTLNYIKLGNRADPLSPFNTRLQHGAPYERQYLSLYKSPGYLELCVSDVGVGIVRTLRERALDYGLDPSKDGEILASAFWARTTRDPGDHRPGLRGLYYVFQTVREHQGLLACECNDLSLAYSFNSLEVQNAVATCPKEQPTTANAVETFPSSMPGTHLRILMPLAASGRRRQYWLLQLQARRGEKMRGLPVLPLPIVHPVPRAVSKTGSEQRRIPMSEFRAACRSLFAEDAVNVADATRGSIAWLAAARTRDWRKPELQGLLDEFVSQRTATHIAIVNIPRERFLAFVFICRHMLPAEDGRGALLMDEAGRFVIPTRDSDRLLEGVRQWAVNRVPFIIPFGLLGKVTEVLSTLATADDPWTGCEYLFAVACRSLVVEFRDTLESATERGRAVSLNSGDLVGSFVQFDEALRDVGYLRTVSGLVETLLKTALKPKRMLVVRRGPRRMLEYRRPLDRRDVRLLPQLTERYYPSADWFSDVREDAVCCIVTDVVFRCTTTRELIAICAARAQAAGTRPEFSVLAPIYAVASPESGVKESLEPTALPYVHILQEGTRTVEVYALQRTIVSPPVEARKNTPSALRLDSETNLIVDVSTAVGRAFPMGIIPPADFILMAERADAIINGHVAIAEEHFDLEFDVPRLLREGGEVSALFVSYLTDIIEKRSIDTVVFPDRSQIETVVPALTDALEQRGMSSPVIIRTRRVSGGEVIVSYRDRAALMEGRRFLIIDDAINSGRTTLRVLRLVLDGSDDPKHISSVALISRQGRDEVLTTHGISSFRDVHVRFECWAHIPVRHYFPGDCPTCRRRDAAVLVAGAAPHGAGLSQYARMLARTLTAEAYYETVRGVAAEQKLVYAVPVRVSRGADGGLTSEMRRFATIGGARAALACAIGEQQIVDGVLVATMLADINDVRLASYVLYQAASRTSDPVGLWGDAVFQKVFDEVTATATPAYGQSDDIVEVRAASIRELARAVWFAPDAAFSRYLAVLLEHGARTLDDDVVYAELILLAYRFAASLGDRDFGGGQEYLRKVIEKAIGAARRSELGANREKPYAMDAVSRLLRLRRLQQVATGEPIIELWLDGVVETLERLGYYSEHRSTGIPSKEAWVEADGIYDELGRIVHGVGAGDDSSGSDGVESIKRSLRRLIDRPREDVGHYAVALTSALTPWLKAAELTRHLKRDEVVRAVESLHRGEKDSRQLVRSLESLDREYQRGQPEDIRRAVGEVAVLLGKLDGILYETSADDRPPLLRNMIESLLCPLHKLARDFRREIVVEQLSSGGHAVTTTGSFFDYSDKVMDHGPPKWIVLLAPARTVIGIIRDVLIGNLKKHWLDGRESARVSVHCDVTGTDSIQVRTGLHMEAVVNDERVILPPEGYLWAKSLGRARRIMEAFGGELEVSRSFDGTTENAAIQMRVRSGHF